MKKCFLLLFVSLLGGFLFAQTKKITTYEYWFDEAIEQVKTVAIPTTETFDLNENLDVSVLDYGLHVVTLRFQDDRGVWSPPVSRFFTWSAGGTNETSQMREITNYQYWFDEDYGNVVKRSVTATSSLNLDELLDVSALDYGLHVVTLRFQDDRGVWSPPVSRFFTWSAGGTNETSQMREITNYQYWFDKDYTSAVTTDVGATATLTLAEQVDVSALAEGLHTINYRFRDERGIWGSPVSRFFSIENETEVPNETPLKITGYRYWFDTDISTMVRTNLATPTTTLSLDTLLDVSTVASGGNHSITCQFRDEHNHWSVPIGKNFFKQYEPRATITADNSPACSNSTIVFTANLIDTDVVVWDFGDGTATATTHSPTHSYKETGTFTVTASLSHTASGKTGTASMTITVSPKTVPVFTAVSGICEGEALSALPTTSTNGITGSWSPALNNQSTTVYTFTPNATECATTASMTIMVSPKTVPVFTAVSSICEGEALSALPTTSTNGITGSWSPALNNQSTTVYTFTPNATECATTASMTITVSPKTVPLFTAVSGICEGEVLSALPTTSTNGITGSWSPALNNQSTTVYTFTPNATECATTASMTITVHPIYNPKKSIVVCAENLPYAFGSQELMKSGTYTEVFQSKTGCDSLVSLKLEVITLDEPLLVDLVQPDCNNSMGRFTISNYDKQVSYEVTPIRNGVSITQNKVVAPEGTYTVIAKKGDCRVFSKKVVIEPTPTRPTLYTHNIKVVSPQVADITKPIVTEGSSSNLRFSYWLNAQATTPLINPESITKTGIYYIKATNEENCSMIAPIEVIVVEIAKVIANPDKKTTYMDKAITIDVSKNDKLIDADKGKDNYSLVKEPTKGKVSEVTDGVFLYIPSLNFSGVDKFSYRLCNRHGNCAEGIVSVTILIPPTAYNLEAEEFLTPNGDGHNDGWVISELLANNLQNRLNKVVIFNQAGEKVYEKENYMADGKLFTGYGNVKGTNPKKLLPDGIYYYVIEINHKFRNSGFLYIIY